jgi:opacity protein-like surface antigen
MIAVWSADAYAQVHSLELIPFGGYRWGGSLSSIPGVRKFDTQDTWTYGVAIDAEMAYDSAAEIYYGHFSGDWDATLISGDKRTGSLNRDDIMLNGIWYAKGGRPAVRPYLTAGLGVSIYSADQISTTGRFAWNFGAGLRHDVSDKVGIRIDGRWIPTWFTTGSSVWCDPFYGCYPTSTGEFFDQFELSGGLMVKLGGN